MYLSRHCRSLGSECYNVLCTNLLRIFEPPWENAYEGHYPPLSSGYSKLTKILGIQI